jgi:integrase
VLKNDGLSPAYADHFAKLLRHALNLAVEWEMLEKNPASRVQLFNADNRVEHYLDDDQLERLLTVLKSDAERNRTARMVALFLLSTGARLNEALRAKWQEVDRDNRVWRIPAATSKSKKVRSVPLNASALEVLDRLDTEDSSEWLS